MGYGPLIEVSFDDGYWEVEAYLQDTAYELFVNPKTGEVIAKHRDEEESTPPADSKRLSEIIAALLRVGYTDVHEVSFERRSWEIEARRNDVKRELRVDPLTAEVISDRADD